MHAQKAFRAKLNAKKQEKQRIDSPLVRYNEHDQPVCRVCDVVIKSESNWPAHQVSRKHHEAIDKLKATAAAQNRPTVSQSESAKQFPKAKLESSRDLIEKPEPVTAVRAHQSSTLPPDFFDNPDKKKQKNERDSSHHRDLNTHKKDSVSAKIQVTGSVNDISSTAPSVETRNPHIQTSIDPTPLASTSNVVTKQVKGALPAGFFDDKDADLLARGIKPVKPDPKDEYKEFEKLIQEDLQEVDNQLEEEERVEMLRRKKLELRASKSSAVVKDVEVASKIPSREESSSDDEDDDVKVDWRLEALGEVVFLEQLKFKMLSNLTDCA
ncbi:zinc finger protein [Striga asiatica]|uniref:Zinc finger protein n=1 Tax=Striga asiatica TaxID=4170 RepID=A0A5A7P409_STRAF|nr:zinc finger protein [Striga asiatica]